MHRRIPRPYPRVESNEFASLANSLSGSISISCPLTSARATANVVIVSSVYRHGRGRAARSDSSRSIAPVLAPSKGAPNASQRCPEQAADRPILCIGHMIENRPRSSGHSHQPSNAGGFVSAPGRTRTCDHQLRSVLEPAPLCPAVSRKADSNALRFSGILKTPSGHRTAHRDTAGR